MKTSSVPQNDNNQSEKNIYLKIKLVSILIFIILSNNFAQEGWFWQNPRPQGNLLRSASIIKTGFGLAVGDFGTILKTTDWGYTWTPRSASTIGNLIKTFVVNNNLVYAIGTSLIKKSTDEGENWFNVTTAFSSQADIFFLDELTGYVTGGNGNIKKTTDGGLSWNSLASGTSNYISSIYFMDSNNGIAGGTPNTLLVTDNGGASWTPLNFQPVYQGYVWDVYMTSKNKIFVLAGSSDDHLYTSTDGGQTFTPFFGSSLYLTEMSFADSLHGMISGYSDGSDNGRIFVTSNGGINWQEKIVNVGSLVALASISYPDTQYAASVGEYGRMVFTNDGGNNWAQTSSGPLSFFYDMAFYDVNHGIATGGSMATSDGGEHWIITQGGSGYKCCMISANLCFAAGGYNLVKSTDGGFTWVRHPISDEHYFLSISFCDSLNGVAAAMLGQGVIFRTTDGGETWVQTSTLYHISHDVCIVNPSMIYACSSYGIVYKSTDGGYNWTDLHTPSSQTIFYAINFVKPNVGYVGGEYGDLFKTTDGGTSWITLDPGASGDIRDINFKDEFHGMAAGGGVCITSDGGNTWDSYKISSYVNYSVSMVTDNIWYAAGDGGSILKTTNGGTPVELVSFNGFMIENEVHLYWQTATETNNKGFEIQKLNLSGKVHNKDWENIGFIWGNGTSVEPHNYLFVDKNAVPGKYWYRLKQIDLDGSFEYSNNVEINIENSGKFSLEQNYPNPFNPVTTINYSIQNDGFVSLKVYNILGQQVADLVNQNQKAGYYNINFNAADLPSGVYIYTIRTAGFTSSKKMLLIK